jgi:type II secretory ATPase GspE/PulE/Tfp pilus assembly ATPase PilB-like protein
MKINAIRKNGLGSLRKSLGEVLIQQGFVNPEQLDAALLQQKAQGGKLGNILVNQGSLKPEQLSQAISIQLNYPLIDLKRHKVHPDALKLIPEEFAKKHVLIPLEIIGDSLVVVMADPDDIQTIEDLKVQTKMRIKTAIAVPEDINWALDLNYRSGEVIEKEVNESISPVVTETIKSTDLNATTPIAESLDLLIEQAIRDRASDIHFEPQENRLQIRYRIDGVLHKMHSLPLSANIELVSRLKILAKMDITQSRSPQDGQFTFKSGNKEIDVRVATTDTLFGERVTLRILDKFQSIFTLPELGFQPYALEQYQAMLNCPFGMIVVGGPTGSGKTTTLYTSLNQLNSEECNILTIEDPVEYRFTNITQTQINVKAGNTFASGLRAMMRQDPDVIMVGEIRDRETATTAIQAAITGHLVLSSIHANDAISILLRLMSMCDDPTLFPPTIIGVVAQRMIRKVCSNCRTTYEPAAAELAVFQEETKQTPSVLYKGTGCNICAHTGYRGRTGLFEILPISDESREMLLSNATAGDIKKQALKEGMVTMRHDGLLKAVQGITTLGEVQRSIYSINADTQNNLKRQYGVLV